MSSFSSSQDSSTTDSCPNEANKLYYYVVTDYFNYRKEVTFEPLKIFKDRAAAIAFAVQLTSKQPSGPIGKYVSNEYVDPRGKVEYDDYVSDEVPEDRVCVHKVEAIVD